MSQILPSHIVNFPKDMDIHSGAKEYYREIGIITYIDNYDCGNYAGSRKCIEKKNNKPHYGHGSIVENKKEEDSNQIVGTLPPTATISPTTTLNIKKN